MAVRRYDYFFDLRGPMSWTGIRIVPRSVPFNRPSFDLNRPSQLPWITVLGALKRNSAENSTQFEKIRKLIGFLRGDMHWSAVKIVSESLYYNQNSAQSDFF